MGNLWAYAKESLSSDFKSLWYSLNDKSYPFFQYRRKVEGSEIPIYENHNFILEFLQAIILIPILIIALLFWNISRALPRGREYANAFPYKVLYLSKGKNRTDYFVDKSSNDILKEQLLTELKKNY